MNNYSDIRLILQRNRYLDQFGREEPFNNDICHYCGKPYGEHYGSECPKEEVHDDTK